MRRIRHGWATIGLLAGTAVGLAAAAAAGPAPVFPPLPGQLFDVPIRENGHFGDHRSNHFHAGLDLDTGGVVGRAVHAPADAIVRRVRASGVGYGRSIYLETADGRLLVFGHLDAFAEPIASTVAARQDSSGQYDQDLWPVETLRVRQGDIIGWTGRSGTGGPHLHVEIRRADMAINPLLAGYELPDTSTPRIERVTFAALDDTSRAGGGSTPATLSFGARDTIAATGWGRLRVIVEALDAESDGSWDLTPWRVRVSQGAEWVQCEFDSASWATDMAQSDFVYDRGRYTARGKYSLVLGSPEGFRSRVFSASAPGLAEAGVVTLDAAHPDAVLSIEAEDLAGHRTQRSVRLEAVRPTANPSRVATRGQLADGEHAAELTLAGRGRVVVPKGALFERAALRFERGERPRRRPGLDPVGNAVIVGPATTPLRAAIDVMLVPPQPAPSYLALYRQDGDDWEYIGDRRDSSGGLIGGGTRHLGRFALFRDVHAPLIKLLAPPRTPPAGAYSRWALEAPLAESGSGVDASASHFVVDGRRVPSEWDAVIGVLRWKPLHAPVRGSHSVTVIAIDRAGNVRRTSASFVID